MKIDIQDLSSTKKKLKLDVPPETVKGAFDQAYREIGKKANIKGFRKGKIPNAILDQHYGADVHMESLNFLVGKTYNDALKEHDLSPVLDPKFNLGAIENGKPYSYEVEVEVKPKFEVKDYLEIPLKKLDAKIDPKTLDEELARLQESRAELKPAEEGQSLEKGGVGTVDFEGSIDGKVFEGGTAKGYVFEVGKGNLLKEFEEKVTGMKAGETRSIDISYPADYPDARFKGKAATFKVTLQALHQKVLPKLDDEFAKDMGKESFAAVKKEIEDMLVKREEQKFKAEYAKEILEYLAKKNQFDVPEGLVQHEMGHGAQGHNHDHDHDHHDHDHDHAHDHAKADDPQQPKKDRKEVEKSLRTQFVLEQIAKKESIQVSPQEVDAHLQYLARLYQQPVSEIRKHFSDRARLGNLILQLVMEKTLDFLIDKAKLN